MGSKYGGSILQGEGCHQELLLLQSCEASCAWNEGGGKGVGKKGFVV